MEKKESDIVKDFFKWIPPKFSAGAVTSKLFHDTVGSDLNSRYPVDNAYCSRFCRYMLDMLEKDDAVGIDDREELIEELYTKIGDLYSSGNTCDAYSTPLHLVHRTYFLSSEDPELSVSMRETRALISDGTTGLTSSEAALSSSSALAPALPECLSSRGSETSAATHSLTVTSRCWTT